MTISSTNIGTGTNAGTGATCAITLGANVPASTKIFVLVYEYGQAANVTTPQSVTDSAGNTYTCDINNINTGSALQVFSAQASAQVNSGGSITYSKSNNGNYVVMSAFYASGIVAASAYDSAGSHAVNAPGSNTSGTPATAGSLFIEAVAWSSSDASTGFTLDTGNGWSAPPPTGVQRNAPSSRSANLNGGLQVNAGTSTKTSNPTFADIAYGGNIIAVYKPVPPLIAALPLKTYLRR